MEWVRLTVDPRLRARALEAHDRFCAEYGCPIPYFRSQDPLSELINSMVNHRTRNTIASAAVRRLRAAYPTWEGVRDAPTVEVERLLDGVTWPDLKAARVQEVLRRITAQIEGGRTPLAPGSPLDLGFLAEWPVERARAWLQSMPGVGPKTSAAAVGFSQLRMRALPVDSHHHRVAERLGLVPPGVNLERAHRVLESYLPEEWGAQQVYDHHEVYMLHGQRCCYWKNPECGRCVVLGLCPTGQQRLAGHGPAAGRDAGQTVSEESSARPAAPDHGAAREKPAAEDPDQMWLFGGRSPGPAP